MHSIFCIYLTSPKRALLGCVPVHTKKEQKDTKEGGKSQEPHQEMIAQENRSPVLSQKGWFSHHFTEWVGITDLGISITCRDRTLEEYTTIIIGNLEKG